MTESEQYFAEAKQAYDDKNFEKAIELLNKINPQDKALYFQAQLNLARIFSEKGEQDKAIETYSSISREDGREAYAQAQGNLARILEGQGEQDKAIEIYRTILREDSSKFYAYAQFDIARILREKGDLDKAIETYRTISREDDQETYAKAQFNLARIFSEKGDKDKAIGAYSAISREDSREAYAQAQGNLARILEGRGEQDKAIEIYRTILREDSSKFYAYAQFDVARILREKGDLDKAIETYRTISREDDQETYAKAQFNLARIFSEKGDKDKAIEAYSAISREDNLGVYAKAQFNLAGIFKEKGEQDKAIEAYSAISHEDSIYSLAQVCLRIFKLEPKYHSKLFELHFIIRKILSILHVDSRNSDNDDCLEVAHYTRPSVAFTLIVNSISQHENVEKRNLFRLNTIQGVNDPKEGCILYEFLGLKEIVGKKDQSAFVSCFTFNHDSLNQFRLYGKDEGREASGVSLVFNVNRFFNNNSEQIFHSVCELDIKNNMVDRQEEPHKSLSLYRCIYLDPQNGYISIAKRTKATFYRQRKLDADRRWMNYQKSFSKKEKELGKLLKQLITILNRISKTKKFKPNVSEVIQYILLPLQYLVKHYAFEEEQECRMISIRSLVQENEKIKTDIAAKSMYVEYPIDVKNAIEKVYLSVGAREYESFFIKALGDSKKVRISDNPFRPKA